MNWRGVKKQYGKLFQVIFMVQARNKKREKAVDSSNIKVFQDRVNGGGRKEQF